MCSEFRTVYVSHVRRQGNKPAHILANYALSLNEYVVWIEETPCCIEKPSSKILYLFLVFE